MLYLEDPALGPGLVCRRQVSQRVEAAALARKQLKGPLEFRVPWPPWGPLGVLEA